MVEISAKLGVSPSNFKEYYAYYLSKHTKQMTRRAHLAGTIVGAVGVVVSAVRADPIGAAVSAAVGAAIVWAGDFAIEQTQPTTFTNPIWSIQAHFKMITSMLKGDMSI